ncbi:MAG: head-tail adaptor protein [Clostridiales bacterium]|nr:head-tail adaptor protein [Clostridiales bacterium]
MARQARAGELRTRIYIHSVSRTTDSEGVSSAKTETSAIGHDAHGREIMYHCKWVNAYGSEVFSAKQLQLRESATLTMRYSPKIQIDQLIYKVGDPEPWEIISINDVENRQQWLEVKVGRREAAR